MKIRIFTAIGIIEIDTTDVAQKEFSLEVLEDNR